MDQRPGQAGETDCLLGTTTTVQSEVPSYSYSNSYHSFEKDEEAGIVASEPDKVRLCTPLFSPRDFPPAQPNPNTSKTDPD